MPKFTLKTILIILTFVAMAVMLVMTRIELDEKSRQLETYRNEMRYLNIDDQTKIHAINIPGIGRKSWRWRIYLPPNRKFCLRAAFDNVPNRGLPENAPNFTMCDLSSGESILSVNVIKENDSWGLALYEEQNGRSTFDLVADINGAETDWLNKRGGCQESVAGRSSTLAAVADEPFILLSYRDGLSPKSGVTATNPNPTDGIVLWIEETNLKK